MTIRHEVKVTVDFPALDALVLFLKEHDEAPGKIAAAAMMVGEATKALKESGAALRAAMEAQT